MYRHIVGPIGLQLEAQMQKLSEEGWSLKTTTMWGSQVVHAFQKNAPPKAGPPDGQAPGGTVVSFPGERLRVAA